MANEIVTKCQQKAAKTQKMIVNNTDKKLSKEERTNNTKNIQDKKCKDKQQKQKEEKEKKKGGERKENKKEKGDHKSSESYSENLPACGKESP